MCTGIDILLSHLNFKYHSFCKLLCCAFIVEGLEYVTVKCFLVFLISFLGSNVSLYEYDIILSVIHCWDSTRYYACAQLVILVHHSPSCSVVGFPTSFLPVYLSHPIEICEANQFLSKVSFTFPWWQRKRAWMGYWKKPNTENLPRRSRVRH